jgi:hypothetical protein
MRLWSKYFIHMHENGIMKSDKIVFKKKDGGRWERVIEVVNLIKVHYMPVWEYHNENFCRINIC